MNGRTMQCSLWFLLAMTCSLGVALPQGSSQGSRNTQTASDPSRENNPVFNVWQYAYIHDGSNANNQQTASSGSSQSNPCLWAIVSCCSAPTNYARDNCFDALQCPGAWFQNLCSQQYIDAATREVSGIFVSRK